MRKLIIIALMAASALPATANAQSRGELQRDRQDIREERRDVRDARRNGTAQDVREERRDVRDARQEYREDRRDYRQDQRRNYSRNDWRGYRNNNRGVYTRGNWRAPFRYNTFRPGIRITSGYYAPRYVIADPWRYRLPQTRGYQRWVRHYDDVLLIDVRRGIVLDVIRSFYW